MKKASGPPLGLLTVAAMLPDSWEQRMVDLNVGKLRDKDIQWADYVFISAMTVQRESVNEVIARCRKWNTKIVAGGPLFTAHRDEFPEVDHLILNEAELTLPLFLQDLEQNIPKHIYTSTEFADISTTPIPKWSLIKPRHYATMNIQYSRGCPYDCHFCDITVLYGHKPRTKSGPQLIAEFDSLRQFGWDNGVFLVDDNFIGNKGKIKAEILPQMITWMETNKHPFKLSTEGTINMADDEELMVMMVKAGFNTVFVGIESPNEASLIECGKVTNKNRDLVDSIHKIQSAGLQVEAGFILGFDNDSPRIFDLLSNFIQETGIVTAMVGLLNAPIGTKLYERLRSEGRLLKNMSGNNTDFSLNFIPKMNVDTLLEGYRDILKKSMHRRIIMRG